MNHAPGAGVTAGNEAYYSVSSQEQEQSVQ